MLPRRIGQRRDRKARPPGSAVPSVVRRDRHPTTRVVLLLGRGGQRGVGIVDALAIVHRRTNIKPVIQWGRWPRSPCRSGISR